MNNINHIDNYIPHRQICQNLSNLDYSQSTKQAHALNIIHHLLQNQFPVNQIEHHRVDTRQSNLPPSQNIQSNILDSPDNSVNLVEVRKGKWMHHEDSKLRRAVTTIGEGKWAKIAKLVNTRNGKQCRERWHNHLRSGVAKDPFTEKEDNIIREKYLVYGSRWKKIVRFLPGRSEN